VATIKEEIQWALTPYRSHNPLNFKSKIKKINRNKNKKHNALGTSISAACPRWSCPRIIRAAEQPTYKIVFKCFVYL
jgi:hypothetical protein